MGRDTWRICCDMEQSRFGFVRSAMTTIFPQLITQIIDPRQKKKKVTDASRRLVNQPTIQRLWRWQKHGQMRWNVYISFWEDQSLEGGTHAKMSWTHGRETAQGQVVSLQWAWYQRTAHLLFTHAPWSGRGCSSRDGASRPFFHLLMFQALCAGYSRPVVDV